MRLSLVPVEDGKTCLQLTIATGTSNQCGGRLRVDKGIAVYPTLSGSMVFLNGLVGPEVANLELHFQDGEVLELPIVERFVLYDIPRARFAAGKRPILLVARKQDGTEVDRRKVSQEPYFGPKSSIWLGENVSP